jgi:predicted enzyme related to lactoylglutathione lyase
MSNEAGRFCWFDLMTTDPEAARSFYTELIGWGTTPFEGAGEPYTMWTNGESTLGGSSTLPDEARKDGTPPHWLSYVLVNDVDATIGKATGLGAKVLVPATDIPKVGRFAMMADPQGAVLAVFTPAGEPPGHDGPPQKGEFSWHELATSDWKRAWSFYEELFGWEKGDSVDMGEMGIYQLFKRKGGEFPLGGMFNKPEQMPGPPFWLYYVRVDDVDEAAKKAETLGGKILNGPMEVPGGARIVQCMDPQGAAFALHSTKS